MQGRIKSSRCTAASPRCDRWRASSIENLERRELLSGQPPLIADAAPYSTAYISGVYRAALGRAADPGSVGLLTQQLEQGQARGTVPALVVLSNEYMTNLVQAAYQQYLGRAAETESIAIWTRLLGAGMHDEQLAAALVASDEFYVRAGGNDAAWIAAAYQALLGRAATASDLQMVGGQLATGLGREIVALQITTSPEHEGQVVNAEYEQYIHAAPDSTSSSFWTANLATYQSTAETLAIDLMCSDSYYEQETGVPPTVVPVPYDIPAWQVRTAQVTADAAASTSPVVFVGDSLTQAWQLPTGQPLWNQYFAPLNALDAGVGGDSTQTLLWRVESGQLDGLSPKVVVLMVGINNILAGDSPRDVAQGVTADIAALRQHLPNSKILLLGVLPAAPNGSDASLLPSTTATNQLLAALADGQNVSYLDLWSDFTNADGSFRPELHVTDGIHLNTAGYTVLAQGVAPQLNRLLNR